MEGKMLYGKKLSSSQNVCYVKQFLTSASVDLEQMTQTDDLIPRVFPGSRMEHIANENTKYGKFWSRSSKMRCFSLNHIS